MLLIMKMMMMIIIIIVKKKKVTLNILERTLDIPGRSAQVKPMYGKH